MKSQKIITTRQLVMVLLLSLLALKVLLLPNLMAISFGRDSYIFLLSMLINDFGILLLLLFLLKKFAGKTFFEIVDYFFGKVVSKIIFVALALFFFAKCCGVFVSTYVYLNENLYAQYNWLLFSIPFLCVLAFCLMRGVGSLGRIVECTFPIIMIGLIVATGVGFLRADFTNLLPFFENGFSKVKYVTSFSYWFGDYMIMIIFFGKIKLDKGYTKKVILSVLFGIVILTLFYTIVYSRYGYNTITHTNAISDILQVQPSSSDIGSFDWVLVLVWDSALFVNFLINAHGFAFCTRAVFEKFSPRFTAILLCALVFCVTYFLKFNIYLFISFAQNFLCYYSAFVQMVFPNILFVMYLIKKKPKPKYIVKNCQKIKRGEAK